MLAPWFTLSNEINATIGNDPSVTVAPLDVSSNPFVSRITVTDHDKAVAIASLMKPRHDFGNIAVVVEVMDGQGNVAVPVVPGSTDDLATMVKTAFCGNAWFHDVVVRSDITGTRVFPVFAKAVVQFANDDLSELHHNYNEVVAHVFADVLEQAPGNHSLNPSTDTQ
jgi:hypothetical protein